MITENGGAGGNRGKEQKPSSFVLRVPWDCADITNLRRFRGVVGDHSERGSSTRLYTKIADRSLSLNIWSPVPITTLVLESELKTRT